MKLALCCNSYVIISQNFLSHLKIQNLLCARISGFGPPVIILFLNLSILGFKCLIKCLCSFQPPSSFSGESIVIYADFILDFDRMRVPKSYSLEIIDLRPYLKFHPCFAKYVGYLLTNWWANLAHGVLSSTAC